MCFADPPKTPPIIRNDPVADAAKAAAEAQATANAETATRRTTRRMSALSTGAGLAPASALGAGKTTLGG
jgi:hypothetical protein